MTFAAFVGGTTAHPGGIIGLMNTVAVPTITALALLVFVWGAARFFFFSSDDEKGRESGKQFMFWGILGLTVLFSVWGLVNLLLSTLGFNR